MFMPHGQPGFAFGKTVSAPATLPIERATTFD
jgi:hypothetical protein